MKTVKNRIVSLKGEKLEGRRVDADLLRSVLKLLIEGGQKALRVRTEGRSTARGAVPNWINEASRLSVEVTEGSTCLDIRTPTVREAAPEQFAQGDLFPEIDPDRPALDYLTESLQAALSEETDASRLYDRQFLGLFRSAQAVFEAGVESMEFREPADGDEYRTTARLEAEQVDRFRELEAEIPAPRHVRVAGKLDTIRHTDHTFRLQVSNGAESIRGIARAGDADRLQSLWGEKVLVAGMAHFTAAANVQRIEAELIRPATATDLRIWDIAPEPPEPHVSAAQLRLEQGPRSGLNAVFGRWPGDETSEQVDSALADLS